MLQADSNSNLALHYVHSFLNSQIVLDILVPVSLGGGEKTFPSFDMFNYFLNTTYCKAEAPFSYSYLLAATLVTHPCDGPLHPNKSTWEFLHKKSLSGTGCALPTQRDYGSPPHYSDAQASSKRIKSSKRAKRNTMHCQDDQLQCDCKLTFPSCETAWALAVPKFIGLPNICNRLHKVSCSYEAIPTAWHHLLQRSSSN